jgi:hypothetical protein
VGELAVQDQEREAAEVVAVQVRHQHQPNLVGILALLLEGDQRGGAAVQQDITAVVARGVQQDAGLEAAAAAEGVTGANEPHLDGVGGHALTLPCMDRPDCDTRQAGTRSAGLGKATDYFDWRLLTVATHRDQYQGASFGCRQEGLGGSLAGRSQPGRGRFAVAATPIGGRAVTGPA